MSTTLKLIIPLLSEKITKEDLTKEAGFVDAYTDDINRPYLDNHIFLMYEYLIDSKQKANRFCRLKEDYDNYNRKVVTIKGKLYIIYTYVITSTSIKTLKQKNIIEFSKNERKRIINFWKAEDDDVTEYILNPYTTCVKYTTHTLPEIDYIEEKKIKIGNKIVAI